jgi:hypothetical protein
MKCLKLTKQPKDILLVSDSTLSAKDKKNNWRRATGNGFYSAIRIPKSGIKEGLLPTCSRH